MACSGEEEVITHPLEAEVASANEMKQAGNDDVNKNGVGRETLTRVGDERMDEIGALEENAIGSRPPSPLRRRLNPEVQACSGEEKVITHPSSEAEVAVGDERKPGENDGVHKIGVGGETLTLVGEGRMDETGTLEEKSTGSSPPSPLRRRLNPEVQACSGEERALSHPSSEAEVVGGGERKHGENDGVHKISVGGETLVLVGEERMDETGIPARGPDAITVQFRWGVETFKRSDDVECGRFVYRSRGSLDGRGGLILRYNDGDGASAHWSLGSPSRGTLYRLENNGTTPAALIGCQPWARSYGGTSHITICRKSLEEDAAESRGWIEPTLLAFERDY